MTDALKEMNVAARRKLGTHIYKKTIQQSAERDDATLGMANVNQFHGLSTLLPTRPVSIYVCRKSYVRLSVT